jgi:hypothetical protein
MPIKGAGALVDQCAMLLTNYLVHDAPSEQIPYQGVMNCQFTCISTYLSVI